MKYLIGFFQLLLKHKLKFLVLFVSALIFTVLLFPFNDLSDLVSTKVAQFTQNQVFLQFEKMGLSFSPSAGLEFSNISVDTPALPTINAKEVVITPGLSSLITQKPAGTVSAKGLFHGNVEISMKPGTKTDTGVERQKIEITAKQLSLADLRDLAQLPMVLKGKVDLTTVAQADLSFQEQPEIDLNIKIDQFELPPSNVQTPMGPLTLPDLKLSSVTLKGRLVGGRLNIEEGIIGKENDEMRGSIKGGIGLQLQNRGGLVPVIGAYNFDVDLTVKKNFQDKAALLLTLLDQYKTPTADGARFALRVSAPGPNTPPNMSALK